MIAKRRREKAGRRKAGDRWWKKSDLAETHADPATRVDSVVVKSRRCWAHVEAPWIGTESQRKVRKSCATVEVGGESNKNNEARQLELRG